MGNTQHLPECLPYYLSHCFLVLLVLWWFQPVQCFLPILGFLVFRVECAALELACAVVVVVVAAAAAVADGESECLKLEESSLRGCGTPENWMLVMKREMKVLVSTAVIEVVPQVRS